MTENELNKLSAAVCDISGALEELQINIVPQLTGADKKQIGRLQCEITNISTALESIEFLMQ